MKYIFPSALFILITSIFCGCSEKKRPKPIGNNVDRPIDIAASSDGKFFYALNSSARGLYKDGSLMVLSPDGQLAATYSMPRMGRTLSVAESDILVTFDRDAKNDAKSPIRLYTAAGSGLSLQKEWQLEGCSPLNGVLKEKYRFFAVSCQSGDLYVGELKSPRSDSTLIKVRNYPGYARKAWYIDSKRELLLGFVMDLGSPSLKDKTYKDAVSWNSGEKTIIDGKQNDVPDVYEETARDRRLLARAGSEFQFVLYDLASEAKAGFPFREHSTIGVVGGELRWLYYNLKSLSGEVDLSLEDGEKYYRTNIVAVKADPSGSEDSFYLSHRGDDQEDFAKHANNIIKVSFSGKDPRAIVAADGSVSTPLTADILSFERVFGFPSAPDQRNDNSYLGGFDFAKLQKDNVLVVNSVRDFIYFKEERYSLTAVNLKYPQDQSWSQTLVSSDNSQDSFYQVAIAPSERVNEFYLLSASYYDDSLRFFKVEFGGAPVQINTLR